METSMRNAALALTFVGAGLIGTAALVPPAAQAAAVQPTAKALATREALRDLWAGHVFWVRNVVTATLAGNKAEATAAENEVVKNAKQIAGAIEPLYGKPASEKLFNLLAGHYGAIKQYLNASVANNKKGQDAAWKALGDNANDIAVFLSGANPNLPADAVRGLLLGHGGHHVQQIRQLQAKQYVEEAKTWSEMTQHMNVISDAITDALVKQFPEKFN